ncbi:MAG: zinc-binding alcohol dehydrogenase family protein [Pseudomonadales bacterium]|nr:zinc-binding alcohol dehydrogenase family protein [Pseudomonadales bacterium]
MQAVVFDQSLDIQQSHALFDSSQPVPEASGHDLLVEVKAISVNPVDAKIRLRALPEKGQAKILGWDAVGVVKAIGSQVSLFNVGDEVFYAGDVTRAGCYSEFQLVDERIVGFKPKNLSNAEAAAVPLTSITAWEILFERLGVEKKSEYQSTPSVLLIVGAAGGVGSMMIQLAKALTDVTVIATASREESQQWVQELGADHVIDHHAGIADELKRLGFDEVSFIASLTQTDKHFADYIEVIKPQGKICLIDDPAEPLDFMALKTKSVALIWELMFTRSLFQTEDMIEQHHLLNKVGELLSSGKIKSTLKQHMGKINSENLIKAHARIETQTMIGKLVLEGF